ncbi:hypothetical protein HY448_01735 [Candidatus Pacearchaeota archaeon]|nr:hypothetical protein [Candidatus Pacearchaeota archaeon]
MEIYFKSRKIKIQVEKVSIYSTGLIFRTKNASNLFFNTKGKNLALTALFVFFPFLILWIDKKNKVVDFKIARPFTTRITSKRDFYSIVEIPFNSKNTRIITFFVGKKKMKIFKFSRLFFRR